MQKLNPTIRWRSIVMFVLGWTLVGLVFSAVNYVAAFAEGNKRFALADALRLNLGFFYLWGFFSLLVFRFSRRFPIEVRPLRARNLLLHLPFILLVAAIHDLSHLTLFWFFTPVSKRQPTLLDCYHSYFGLTLYLDLLFACLIVIAAHALLYYRRLRVSELEQSALKAQLVQAQLKALKMQLHPHFLFNTLHSISSLILEDPPKANAMIARLGDFLRLTLEHSEEQLVSLKEEAEFLRCYLEIEQVRFGDRLTVDFRIEPATLSAHVPHMILQPVVENAIQHGIAPRITSGHVRIEAKRHDGLLRLEVEDNGPGITTGSHAVEPHGLGLSNVRARLTQIYGAASSFEMTNGSKGGLTVVISLPFQPEATATA
jgi:two-component system LytT family sensor kinase